MAKKTKRPGSVRQNLEVELEYAALPKLVLIGFAAYIGYKAITAQNGVRR